MKYSLFFLLFIFGCATGNDDKNPKSSSTTFLENQLLESKKSLQDKLKGDERKYAPIYMHATAFDDQCNKVIASLSKHESAERIRARLRTFKEANTDQWGQDNKRTDLVFEEYAKNEIEELIQKTDYSDSNEIIARINLINYTYWTRMNALGDRYDFIFDDLEVVTKNQIGREGTTFETELLPAMRSSTKNVIVRTGGGYDSSKKLIGKIDTLKLNESHFPVYTVNNPKRGVYDIPAEIIAPAANGQTGTVRFTIHYEIK